MSPHWAQASEMKKTCYDRRFATIPRLQTPLRRLGIAAYRVGETACVVASAARNLIAANQTPMAPKVLPKSKSRPKAATTKKAATKSADRKAASRKAPKSTARKSAAPATPTRSSKPVALKAKQAPVFVPRAMAPIDDDDDLLAHGGGGGGFGRCGGRPLSSQLEQSLCNWLGMAGIVHSHSPRHYEVRYEQEGRVAAYAPQIVLRGRGREGKSVVIEAVEDPNSPILRKIIAFRGQYGQEFYVIVVATDEILDELPLAAYDESCSTTNVNTLIARLAE
ncbi:MAG: hypothetical protein KDC98_13180 [Planctomycetes bacterium]|nr:hypothetical protein [Planctomycetota bacterium]